MYLQITTKCNMNCDHCCYSCSMKGKHMDWSTFIDSISFIIQYGNESISIGGGEPTLHPRFFDILKECLNEFDYVWLATNGSQTESMFRLSDIIEGNDYADCDCSQEEIESGYCTCLDNAIYQENKLSVALSQDHFHDEIDYRIVELWTKRANIHRRSNYEVRDVSRSIINQGRAKKTGVGWNEYSCICPDLIINPSGKVKLCGCTNAPYIGDIWNGISTKWENIINQDIFRDENCYNAYNRNLNKGE